jgi:hypothetical protein
MLPQKKKELFSIGGEDEVGFGRNETGVFRTVLLLVGVQALLELFVLNWQNFTLFSKEKTLLTHETN